MSRILMSLGMIVFVGAVVVGGTGAFFSDTETSTGNVFAAGAIDLLIDNSSYGFDWNDPTVLDPVGNWQQNQNNSWSLDNLTNQLFFNFHDLKPGDYGEDTISMHVQNDAWACMAMDLTGTLENNLNEAENEAGDVTDGVDEGELQNYLSFIFWYDDGDNVLEDDETVIEELSGLPGSIFTGEWLAIAESGDDPLEAGDTTYIGKGWCFGEITRTPVANGSNEAPNADTNRIGYTCDGSGDNNDAQTDGINVDVFFYAEQARNNDQFLCSGLDPIGGRAVGTNLAAYDAPATETCDVTVDKNVPARDTIAEGLALATSGQKVCVNDGVYDETVVIDEPTVLAALNGPLNSATINGGVQIDSSDVTVTGFIIVPGDVPADSGNIGVFLNGSLSNVRVTYNNIDGSSFSTPGDISDRGVLTASGATYTNVFIENNEIHDLQTGIYTNPMLGAGPFYIRFNDIDDNVAGIGGLNGAIVVANEFEHEVADSEAIGLDDSFDDNPTTSLTQNNFLDGVQINTYGSISTIIDAENNFFNLGGIAQVDETNGDIDFTPEAGVIFPHN